MNAQAPYRVGACGSFFRIAAYFAAWAMRPMWVRALNGSALFFTGLGLMQLAILVRTEQLGMGWINANIAVIALVCAVLAKAWVVLRNRKAWDGVERRAPAAEPK